MRRLKALEKVKDDLRKIEAYVALVENYKTETLAQKIIKSYACTSSLSKTLSEVNRELRTINQPCLELSFVTDLIKSRPQDELHKLVRASYFSKIKTPRPRSSFKS